MTHDGLSTGALLSGSVPFYYLKYVLNRLFIVLVPAYYLLKRWRYRKLGSGGATGQTQGKFRKLGAANEMQRLQQRNNPHLLATCVAPSPAVQRLLEI